MASMARYQCVGDVSESMCKKIWIDDVQNECERTLPLVVEVRYACALRARPKGEEGGSSGSTTSTQGWWYLLLALDHVRGVFPRLENETGSGRGTTME